VGRVFQEEKRMEAATYAAFVDEIEKIARVHPDVKAYRRLLTAMMQKTHGFHGTPSLKKILTQRVLRPGRATNVGSHTEGSVSFASCHEA
jgi:hypothetical protein